jgi:hypothetical protein
LLLGSLCLRKSKDLSLRLSLLRLSLCHDDGR